MREFKKKPQIRFPEFKESWEESLLSDFLTKYSENNSDNEFAIDDILSLSSIHGIVDRKELLEDTYSNVNHLNYKKTRLNDFVYGKSISSSYPFGLFKVNNCKDGLLSTLYFTFKVKDYVNPMFLDLYFSHLTRANNFLRKYVLVGDRYITADSDYLLSGKIYLPTQIDEQQKIASFLTVIDEKLQALKKKKTLLEQYKKGVMQKLFSKELRFKDENGKDFPDWDKKKLGEVLIEKIEKSTKSNQYRILSSTSKGLFNQDEYFTRDIASKDNTGYKILRKGQLVFSPQNLWLGNINVNMKIDIGVVSPSYKVFSFNERFTSAKYCQYLLLLPEMMFKYEQSSVQGASVVRRNLDMDKFLDIEIHLPSSTEQTKIANFLSSIDDKINITQSQIEKTEVWKKGLLQKMFV